MFSVWMERLHCTCYESVQFSLVTQSSLTLCNRMGCSLPGFPVPSPTPRVCSNSCPLSRWCHAAISSSVVPFCTHLQSFPASGYFEMSQFFASDGQSTGVSASASVLPVNSGLIPLGWTIGSPCSPRDSQESSPTPQFKNINSLVLNFLYTPTLSHPYTTTGKTIALTRRTFVGKVMSLLFNMLSRLVVTFLPRSVF